MASSGNLVFQLTTILILYQVVQITCNCKRGWSEYKGACYHSNYEKMDHESAMKYCKSKDSVLASVHTMDEIDWLVKKIIAVRDDPYFWLGGRPFSYGIPEYTWLDKSPFNFTRWTPHSRPQEPNEYQTPCSGLVLDRSGWMLDDKCDQLRSPICKIWLNDSNSVLTDQWPAHVLDRVLRSEPYVMIEKFQDLRTSLEGDINSVKSLTNDVKSKVSAEVQKVKNDANENLTKLDSKISSNIGEIRNYTYFMDGKFEQKVKSLETGLSNSEANLRTKVDRETTKLEKHMDAIKEKFSLDLKMTIADLDKNFTRERQVNDEKLSSLESKGSDFEAKVKEQFAQLKKEAAEVNQFMLLEITNLTTYSENRTQSLLSKVQRLEIDLSLLKATIDTKIQAKVVTLEEKLDMLNQSITELKGKDNNCDNKTKEDISALNQTIEEILSKLSSSNNYDKFIDNLNDRKYLMPAIAVSGLLLGFILGCCCCKRRKHSRSETIFVPKATYTKKEDGSQFVRFNENLYDDLGFK